MSFFANAAASITTSLFSMTVRPSKDLYGIALCVLFKAGWVDGRVTWANKSLMEPLLQSTTREKDDKIGLIVVFSVPALERYRPKIFNSIREMCSALSSRSLPRLKKNFMKVDGGLNLEQFTTTLFNQLYETNPKVIDAAEAPYVVALLHEMFFQIGKSRKLITLLAFLSSTNYRSTSVFLHVLLLR